jgi:hypothetical protein
MSRVVLACLVGAVLALNCDQGSGEKPATILAIDDAVDALDEAYCERLNACDCNEEWQPTQQECRDQIAAQIDAWQQDGEANGLEYDGSCLGAVLDALDELGCEAAEDGDDDDEPQCVAQCRPYHGRAAVGGLCHSYGQFDDCAQGLRCQIETCDGEDDCTGTCRDPCARAEVGENCDELQCVEGAQCDYQTQRCRSLADEGESCSNFACREDLVCDFENDRCVVLPSVGDSCFQGACAEGAFCVADPADPTMGTCTAPGELDEACMGHRQCESGYCPAGFCRELPGKGEECFGTCADGLACEFEAETSKCVEAPAAVCNSNPI